MVQELYLWRNNDNDKNGFVETSISNTNKLHHSINTVKEDYGYLDFDYSDANHKRIRLMEDSNHHHQQQKKGRTLDCGEPKLLGLSLRKTPSFLDLIDTRLSKRKKAPFSSMNQTTNNGNPRPITNYCPAEYPSEKLKASNFTATMLRIGSWEKVAKHEGDLVAKCYYAKRKIVWEVLDQGLKSKIEIQWSDISAIRAVFLENEPDILELELSIAPSFHREMNPQPRKHTLWQPATDFTGGQAPLYRRHYVKFPEGTLEKSYQKLLQCDERLFMLSQRCFPSSNNPFFQSELSQHQNFYLNFKGNEPESTLPYHQCNIQMPVTGGLLREDMSLRGFEQQRSPFINQEMVLRSRGGNQDQVHSFLHHQDSNSFRNEIERLDPNGWQLNAIAYHLLDEATATICSDDQRVLAKIRSMNCLLEAEKEQHTNAENTRSSTVTSSNGDFHTTYRQCNEDLFMGLERISSFPSLYFVGGDTSM